MVAAPGLAPEPCGSGPAPDRGIGPAGPLRRVCLDQHGGARCLDVSHTAADQSRACNLEEALGPHLQEVRGRAPEPYTARGAEPDPGIAGVRIQRGEQSGLCSPCSRADRRYRDVLPTCREGQSYADSVHAILVGPICADEGRCAQPSVAGAGSVHLARNHGAGCTAHGRRSGCLTDPGDERPRRDRSGPGAAVAAHLSLARSIAAADALKPDRFTRT